MYQQFLAPQFSASKTLAMTETWEHMVMQKKAFHKWLDVVLHTPVSAEVGGWLGVSIALRLAAGTSFAGECAHSLWRVRALLCTSLGVAGGAMSLVETEIDLLEIPYKRIEESTWMVLLETDNIVQRIRWSQQALCALCAALEPENIPELQPWLRDCLTVLDSVERELVLAKSKNN